MEQNILKFLIEKGFLLDKEMFNFLKELGNEEIAEEILNKIAVVSNKKIITKNLINENLDKIKPFFLTLEDEKKKLIEKFFVNISISVEVKKESSLKDEENFDESNNSEIKNSNYKNSDIKIIYSPIIQFRKLEVKDFVRYFRTRYIFMKNLLQQRYELQNLTSIDKINRNNRNFSIIGIVNNKQITKNKNILLEVEDLTGKTKLLVSHGNEELFKKAKEILLDDIIGFKCSGSRDFLYVNDFFYPDCFLDKRKSSDEEVYAVFISDIHVGSKNFLEKNFERFIDWISGKNGFEEYREIQKKIKYLFVVGDSIDGVGVYPGQEKFLDIKNIKDQYAKLAEYYKRIPPKINIIQCAGQHDGVRVAEPQPPIGKDFGEALYEVKNLFLVSNPSVIEIESKSGKDGIKVLMYHGASMNSIINEAESLRLTNAHRNPTKALKYLLVRRHLSPIHGQSVYIPSSGEDPMIIREIPDIVASGDLHRVDIDWYNNVLMIASSCWQSMTPFEEKVGNIPDPCKVPILNLKTFDIKILDFSDV